MVLLFCSVLFLVVRGTGVFGSMGKDEDPLFSFCILVSSSICSGFCICNKKGRLYRKSMCNCKRQCFLISSYWGRWYVLLHLPFPLSPFQSFFEFEGGIDKPQAATPTVDAQLAYDCLNSAPLDATAATALVDSILPYVEWQSGSSSCSLLPFIHLQIHSAHSAFPAQIHPTSNSHPQATSSLELTFPPVSPSS